MTDIRTKFEEWWQHDLGLAQLNPENENHEHAQDYAWAGFMAGAARLDEAERQDSKIRVRWNRVAERIEAYDAMEGHEVSFPVGEEPTLARIREATRWTPRRGR